MFLATEERLNLRAEELYRLRISLNTPEVETDDLDGGAARALILVHFDEAAGATASVAIRALKTGRSVIYRYQPQQGNLAIDRAVEAALDFAETLGFHFGDEKIPEVDERAQAQALAVWIKFTQADSKALRKAAQAEPASRDRPTDDLPKKLVRADVAEPEIIDLGEPIELERPVSTGGTSARLSKFRDSDSQSGQGATTGSRRRKPIVVYPGNSDSSAGASHRGRRKDDPKLATQALGRVQLVKRAVSNPNKSDKRNPVERLLSSF